MPARDELLCASLSLVPPYWINPALAGAVGPKRANLPCEKVGAFPGAIAEPLDALGRSVGSSTTTLSDAPTCALRAALFSHSRPCLPFPCPQVRQHVSPSCPLYVGRSHPRVIHSGTGPGGGAGTSPPCGTRALPGGGGAAERERPSLLLISAEIARIDASSRPRALVPDAGLRDGVVGSWAPVGSLGSER